ncbi:KOW domain-containing RNA-binding protein [Tissierella sp.]|uniref:KOW domain-containing RNA-binding protein n=1 Tax=Tissierella sp. TaxID=41274 RepID=UPI00285EF34B|nr:KOW domain-containing RNA-binding protein [Tissierella sp.]MDR7857649.1 KOW domain-containing RNA-binding protein [Tissierella sp.]
MDLSNHISIGQVVKSRAGRDKGRIFLVINIIDEKNVLIVDGDLRKLDNPKQKKLKHLIIYNTVVSELSYQLDNNIEINNAYIRKILEPFNKSF